MVSGGPGDHWLTDPMNWHLPALGRPQDDLIREIIRLGGLQTLEKPPWDARLMTLWPRWTERSEEAPRLAALVTPLLELRDRLRAEAIDGGWEVD
jgi:hypothetical protein